MSSRWSPGQPSVFRSRWGTTKAISENGIDSLFRLVDRSNNDSTLNTAHPSQPVPDRCATVVND